MSGRNAVSFALPHNGSSGTKQGQSQRGASSCNASNEPPVSRSASSFSMFMEGGFGDLLESHVSFQLEDLRNASTGKPRDLLAETMGRLASHNTRMREQMLLLQVEEHTKAARIIQRSWREHFGAKQRQQALLDAAEVPASAWDDGDKGVPSSSSGSERSREEEEKEEEEEEEDEGSWGDEDEESDEEDGRLTPCSRKATMRAKYKAQARTRALLDNTYELDPNYVYSGDEEEGETKGHVGSRQHSRQAGRSRQRAGHDALASPHVHAAAESHGHAIGGFHPQVQGAEDGEPGAGAGAGVADESGSTKKKKQKAGSKKAVKDKVRLPEAPGSPPRAISRASTPPVALCNKLTASGTGTSGEGNLEGPLPLSMGDVEVSGSERGGQSGEVDSTEDEASVVSEAEYEEAYVEGGGETRRRRQGHRCSSDHRASTATTIAHAPCLGRRSHTADGFDASAAAKLFPEAPTYDLDMNGSDPDGPMGPSGRLSQPGQVGHLNHGSPPRSPAAWSEGHSWLASSQPGYGSGFLAGGASSDRKKLKKDRYAPDVMVDYGAQKRAHADAVATAALQYKARFAFFDRVRVVGAIEAGGFGAPGAAASALHELQQDARNVDSMLRADRSLEALAALARLRELSAIQAKLDRAGLELAAARRSTGQGHAADAVAVADSASCAFSAAGSSTHPHADADVYADADVALTAAEAEHAAQVHAMHAEAQVAMNTCLQLLLPPIDQLQPLQPLLSEADSAGAGDAAYTPHVYSGYPVTPPAAAGVQSDLAAAGPGRLQGKSPECGEPSCGHQGVGGGGGCDLVLSGSLGRERSRHASDVLPHDIHALRHGGYSYRMASEALATLLASAGVDLSVLNRAWTPPQGIVGHGSKGGSPLRGPSQACASMLPAAEASSGSVGRGSMGGQRNGGCGATSSSTKSVDGERSAPAAGGGGTHTHAQHPLPGAGALSPTKLHGTGTTAGARAGVGVGSGRLFQHPGTASLGHQNVSSSVASSTFRPAVSYLLAGRLKVAHHRFFASLDADAMVPASAPASVASSTDASASASPVPRNSKCGTTHTHVLHAQLHGPQLHASASTGDIYGMQYASVQLHGVVEEEAGSLSGPEHGLSPVLGQYRPRLVLQHPLRFSEPNLDSAVGALIGNMKLPPRPPLPPIARRNPRLGHRANDVRPPLTACVSMPELQTASGGGSERRRKAAAAWVVQAAGVVAGGGAGTGYAFPEQLPVLASGDKDDPRSRQSYQGGRQHAFGHSSADLHAPAAAKCSRPGSQERPMSRKAAAQPGLTRGSQAGASCDTSAGGWVDDSPLTSSLFPDDADGVSSGAGSSPRATPRGLLPPRQGASPGASPKDAQHGGGSNLRYSHPGAWQRQGRAGSARSSRGVTATASGSGAGADSSARSDHAGMASSTQQAGMPATRTHGHHSGSCSPALPNQSDDILPRWCGAPGIGFGYDAAGDSGTVSNESTTSGQSVTLSGEVAQKRLTALRAHRHAHRQGVISLARSHALPLLNTSLNDCSVLMAAPCGSSMHARPGGPRGAIPQAQSIMQEWYGANPASEFAIAQERAAAAAAAAGDAAGPWEMDRGETVYMATIPPRVSPGGSAIPLLPPFLQPAVIDQLQDLMHDSSMTFPSSLHVRMRDVQAAAMLPPGPLPQSVHLPQRQVGVQQGSGNSSIVGTVSAAAGTRGICGMQGLSAPLLKSTAGDASQGKLLDFSSHSPSDLPSAAGLVLPAAASDPVQEGEGTLRGVTELGGNTRLMAAFMAATASGSSACNSSASAAITADVAAGMVLPGLPKLPPNLTPDQLVFIMENLGIQMPTASTSAPPDNDPTASDSSHAIAGGTEDDEPQIAQFKGPRQGSLIISGGCGGASLYEQLHAAASVPQGFYRPVDASEIEANRAGEAALHARLRSWSEAKRKKDMAEDQQQQEQEQKQRKAHWLTAVPAVMTASAGSSSTKGLQLQL